MRISHRHRFIFFANPKTGSASVRKLLDPYSDVWPARDYRCTTARNPFYPHMTPMEMRAVFRRYRWEFDGYRKFVFVRNPWARLVSLFMHIQRGETLPRFDVWLSSVRTCGTGGGGEPWQRWRRYGAYSIESYVGDDEGQILVDQVLRLEDIEVTLKPFLASLGLPNVDEVQIPRCNCRVDQRHYSAFYTPESAETVRDLYRYDIETYGYAFGA